MLTVMVLVWWWVLAAVLLALGSLTALFAVQAYRRQYRFHITVTAGLLAPLQLLAAVLCVVAT